MRTLSVLLAELLFVFCLTAQVPGDIGTRVLLPNGWWLSPAGEQIRLGDFPMNAALSEDEAYLAVTHGGQSKAQIMLVDLNQKKVTQSIRLRDSWQGIAFRGNMLYVSGGYRNCIYTFKLEQGKLVEEDSIMLIDWNSKLKGAAAGLDVHGNTLAVVFRADSTLRYYDLQTKKQTVVRLDGMPYSCAFDAKGMLIVSIWSSKRIQVFDGAKKVYQCATGDHPNEVLVSKDSRYAYIACSNDNTVSIIDLRKKKAIASVVTAIHPDAPEGSTTNSVCLTSDQKTILAANADNNSLTVVDVQNPLRPRPLGFIPVGWYPTKVLMLKDNTVLVLNGKGGRSFANPKNQYIGGLFDGTLSIFRYPDDKTLAEYSQQVFRNTPYKQASLLKSAYDGESSIPKKVGQPSPIKHVFYIIKENRTYDQVFGDMPEGNGDSSLCLFGETVTPNHHKLAREFVLMDNFYVNSEVSADGHNWSMAAYATDYVEKTWPTQYGGRGGEYDFEGTEPTGRPKAGFLWSACARKGVSFRVYGEFIDPPTPEGKAAKPRDPAIGKNFSTTYRGWDLDYSDVDRFKAWQKEFSEFEKNGKLPSLSILHLPNDHTAGTRKGALTPKAYVAQNDHALGLIVERISKSQYWKETAIFVVEDDAQNGPDHVDAHRSVGLVISPYTKGRGVDHTLYSTTSMLRSMELILGLPPMSQYDAGATPMFNAFSSTAELSPYVAEQPRIDLNEKNKPGSYGQSMMEKFNLRREDAAPDRLFNEIIWQSIKGTPMPAPRYSIFSRASVADDDD
jgi:DNA-binding beta-propeller fold protein YncE